MSEKEKKAFVLRISPAILKEVELWAGDEFRSTNGQIEFLLSEAIKARRRKFNKKDEETT